MRVVVVVGDGADVMSWLLFGGGGCWFYCGG